jgi:sugar lactone lactonase YvrE
MRLRQILSVVIVALVAGAGLSSAATFTVINGNDSGTGSLREAITQAELSGGSNVIVFDADYTISLLTALPDITTDLTISGTGWERTIVDGGRPPGGGSGVGCFSVTGTGSLVLDAVTVRNCYRDYSNGVTGAAVQVANTASVTVTNSLLQSNEAIYGGAISAWGSATVELVDSTFDSNQALGGGVMEVGSVTATGCTFSNNLVTASGNPVAFGHSSVISGTSATLTNCTVSGNHGEGDRGTALNLFSSLQLEHVTIAHNSADLSEAGIGPTSSLTVHHSILADNSGGNCDPTITLTAATYNIEDTDTCGFGGGTGNLINTDPLLDPLGDYGGPTHTHALSWSSPAKEAGDCATSSVSDDQRGVSRPQEAECDIGAFENAPERLAGLWRFNEAAGTMTRDHSVFDNDGTISNATWLPDDPERRSVLVFDGDGDVVSIPDGVADLTNADFTIAAWVNLTEAGNAGGFLAKCDGDRGWQAGEKQLWFGDGGLCCDVDGERPSFVGYGNDYIIADTDVPMDGWHHIAVVWDHDAGGSGEGRWHLDGTRVENSRDGYFANNPDNPDDTLYIGWDGSSEAVHDFLGQADDVAVFAAALDEALIQRIMEGDFGEFLPQASRVYWTEQAGGSTSSGPEGGAPTAGTLMSARLNGSDVRTLATGLDTPSGVAVDPIGRKVYWTEWYGTTNVRRSNLDGSDIENLVSDDNANEIDLDLGRGFMYWTDSGDDTIKRAGLDGSNPQTIVASAGQPEGIAVDPRTGRFYWGDAGVGIRRCEQNGAGVTLLVPSTGGIRGVSLDIDAETIYWVDTQGNLHRANLDGTNADTLASGLSFSFGVDLDPSTGVVLVAEYSSGEITATGLDGKLPQVVASSLASPLYLAIDRPRDERFLLFDGFETGDTSRWSSSSP